MSAKQATAILLAVLLLLAAGAREWIAYQISKFTFLEKLGLKIFCGSLFVLIALRALGIIDIVQIIFK